MVGTTRGMLAAPWFSAGGARMCGRIARLLLALALLAGTAVACEYEQEGGAATTLADASPPHEGGSDDAGAETGSSGSTLTKFDYGYAATTGVLSFGYLIGENLTSVSASFVKSRSAGPERRLGGECVVRTGLPADLTRADRALPGAVTMSGGDPPYTKTFTPTATSFTEGEYAKVQHFAGGEDVHFSSTGAEVPSFDLHLALPLVLRLTQPSISAGAPVLLPHDRDVEMTWERGADGIDLFFEAVESSGSGPEYQQTLANCRFDSSSGHATLPKEVLTAFSAGSSARLFTLAFRRTRIGIFETEVRVLTSVYFPPPSDRAVELEFE